MLQIQELHTHNRIIRAGSRSASREECLWDICPCIWRKRVSASLVPLSFQALNFLECLEEAVTDRSVSHIRAEEVGSKCRSAGEHQLCLPFLLILSSGSIPSRSGFNRKLTYLLCPLQVLQSVWWWWHVKERGPEVHKSCYKFLITKNHYMCHSSNSWSLHGTHQEAAQLFISHLSDTVRYLWQTLDISSK